MTAIVNGLVFSTIAVFGLALLVVVGVVIYDHYKGED